MALYMTAINTAQQTDDHSAISHYLFCPVPLLGQHYGAGEATGSVTSRNSSPFIFILLLMITKYNNASPISQREVPGTV